MMNDGAMNGMGFMMGGMGLVWILVAVFLIAGIVFFIRRSR